MMRLAMSSKTAATLVAVVMLLLLVSANGVERRRPLYRRTSTTTASSVGDDSEGSESKYKPSGKDLYTVSDSYPVSGGVGAGSFKPDGDKLTSFSEYSFGSTKLSGTEGTLGDGGVGSDEESPFAGFKNHKKTSPLLPTTNASNKDRKAPGAANPFDYLNSDYAKPKAPTGILNDAGLGGLGTSKSRLPSTISSKFSISHPSPAGTTTTTLGGKAAGKLAHLDDSTEYDVYAGLGQSSLSSSSAISKSKLAKHRQPLGTASGFEGKVKKVPFKYEDGGLGALGGKLGKPGKTTKLSLDDDSTYGSSHGSLGSASSPFPGLGSFESGAFGGGRQQQTQVQQQQQQQAQQFGKGGKFSFAEPPPLVKSTLNTLKHFGEGLIGNNGNSGAGRSPYELESEESAGGGFHGAKFGSYFGKGQFGGAAAGSPPVEESYESSAEPLPGAPGKGKFAKPLGGKFATDFDVKNIKLTDAGGFGHGLGLGGAHGHKLPPAPPAHHGKHGHTLHSHHNHHSQLHHSHSHSHSAAQGQQLQQQHAPLPSLHHQPQPLAPHHTAHPHTAHGTPHGTTTGTITNPNPLDFRPNFKLQDVPNLYPADHLGAGIAAKGQIESFLNSEHALKDESLVAQLLGDSSPAARPHYHQFLKSQEDEKLEKEALRQQIEYLKAQAAKRPIDLAAAGPHRPAIVSNAQKFRPVRRIPSHVRLGVKAPYPLPRIPNYNDRPYSISFKI